jgi:4-aminobutyrate aminotransferase-like enzyme
MIGIQSIPPQNTLIRSPLFLQDSASSMVSRTEYESLAGDYLFPTPRSSPILTSGKGQIVKDIEGKEYLDFFAGAGSIGLGHNHPEVLEAVSTQMQKISGSSFMNYTLPVIGLAEKIAKIVPGNLKKSLYLNSGTEAVERAIQIAQKFAFASQRANGVLALTHSYHGQMGIASALTGLESSISKQGLSLAPGIIHAPAPYAYRCALGSDEKTCSEYSLAVIEELIRCSTAISTVIYEPILGVGGVIIPPASFHEGVMKICRRYGITLVVDEIFTGLGRTGKFFASQHWNVLPDIMTIGKNLSGVGLPIGAVVTTDKIASTAKPSDYISTFGANPLVCTAAETTIDIIIRDKLHENSAKVGDFILKALQDMKSRHPLIGDVRGKGLLLGIEIINPADRSPAPSQAQKIKLEAQKRGLIFSISGLTGSTIRLSPPLIVTESDAERFLDIFGAAIAASI